MWGIDNLNQKEKMNNSTIKSRASVPVMVKPIVINNQIRNTAQKVDNKKHLNFLSCFKVNYYFFRALGLWPFSFARDSNGRVQKPKITKIDLLWFIASILLYISASIVFIKNKKISGRKEWTSTANFIINRGENIRIVLSHIFIAISIGIDMCNRFKFVNALKMFVHFDESVSQLEIDFNYKREYRRTLLHCTIQTGVTIFVETIYHGSLVNAIAWHTILNHFVFELLLFFVLTAISTSFVTVLLSLKTRYAALNTHLRDIPKLTIQMSKKDAIRAFQFIGRQYSHLADIMHQSNHCYSFQMVLFVGTVFINVTFDLYSCCQHYLHGDDNVTDSCPVELIWVVFHLCLISIVLYAATGVTNEGKNTLRIVHDISNSCDNIDVITALTQLSLQIQHRLPVVSCTFFVLDWRLLFTMGATIITYFMILLNFE